MKRNVVACVLVLSSLAFGPVARGQGNSSGKDELGGATPLEYRYENLRLAFTPTGLGWSGSAGRYSAIKKGVNAVPGRLVANASEIEGANNPQLAERGVIYENAYGEGLHLGVLTKNLVFRKIVRFEALDNLGAIPEQADFLEVEFELSTGPGTTFEARFGGDELLQRIRAIADNYEVDEYV